MTNISDKISAIEKQLDITGYRFGGEDVWPVIRIAIYLSSTKSTSGGRVSPLKKLNFLLAGGWHFIKNQVFNLTSDKHEVALVTTSHYKVLENGRVYDRIIDPILRYLKDNGKTFRVFEFTAKYAYDKGISYRKNLRPIHQEVYFLSSMKRIFSRSNYKLTGDISTLNHLLQIYEINFSIDASFIKKLELIFLQADYFEMGLRKSGVKHLFVVCYYDAKCFSFMLAANRLGLQTIDLQHGVQGKQHMAYAKWPLDILCRVKFLPTHFYVWDRSSFNTILEWKQDTDKVLLGSNKWFEERIKKVSDNIILLSLQPVDDFLPDYLLSLIKGYTGNKKWYARLHPRQMDEIDKIESLFAREGLLEKVDVRKASHTPLTDLLQHTAIHITFYSSVAIEAGYFQIPTYFLSEKGMSYFTDFLDEKLIYCYPKDDFTEVLAKLDTIPADAEKHEDRINTLDRLFYD